MKSYYEPSDNKIEQLRNLANTVLEKLNDKIISNDINNNELTIVINKQSLLSVIKFLKEDKNCLFSMLIDITAVDYISNTARFTVVYHLLSLVNNLRIRIRFATEENSIIESLKHIYANADWLEREVWDMFGLYFNNHDDLRRLLTDFGFDGHPLRKDFPVTGFTEVIYDPISEKVIYKPLELSQEYRSFNYRNPWMDNIEADTFNYINKKDTTK